MIRLKYLPLAQRDLRDIMRGLQQFPYSCKVYQPIHPLEAEYRMLPVKNYLVFYVVTEHEVEIHRIIYAKMDVDFNLNGLDIIIFKRPKR